jgi:hypothetical protein
LKGGLPRLQNRLRGSAPHKCRCPGRSGEQRRRALARKANEVRSAKAALKKQLAAGTIGLADRQRRELISLLHR